jgi:hypothetical protein
MTAALQEVSLERPVIHVDVVESGTVTRPGTLHCVIDEHLSFDTAGMESYFFAQWKPVLYDAFLLAAAVEFCDITKRRPVHGWGRDIHLHVPVHDPERWTQEEVVRALHDALDFLTGDRWQVTVYARQKPVPPPRQGLFSLGDDKTVQQKLDRLLAQHRSEWESFIASLGPTSFVAKWACEARS